MRLRKYTGILICALTFAAGIAIAYYFTLAGDKNVSLAHDGAPLKFSFYKFDSGIFFRIFSKNLIVGSLLSVIGYLTGGLATLLILIWNGIIVGELVKYYGTNFTTTLQLFLWHGLIEIYAYCLFGVIGLKGYAFYRQLFADKPIRKQLPKINEFILPTALLLVAGIIESTLINSGK